MIYSINFKEIVEFSENTRRIIKSIKGPLVYRINHKELGKCYIGSTRNLYERLYCKLFGYYWKIIGENKLNVSRIHKAIMRYGFDKFDLEVLELFDDIKKAHDAESSLIDKYDSYFSGYNSTPSGHWKNRSDEVNRKGITVWVTNGIESRMVPKNLLGEFEKRGYWRGSTAVSNNLKGTVFLHNDFETIRIHPEDVEAALENGYILGKGFVDPKLGRIVVTDGVITKFITKEQLPDYLDRGFYKGKDETTKSSMRGLICMTNDVIDIRVNKSNIEYIEYLYSIGFRRGKKDTINRHLRYVTNIVTYEIKRIHPDTLDEYVNSGNWIKGRKTKEQVQRLVERRSNQVV